MTTHDDSNITLLERDLRTLAESRPEDERLRATVREQLEARAAPRPRRPARAAPWPRRRPSMRIALGSAAAAALAVVGLVFLVGENGSGGPAAADAAVVHHALTAVTSPANAILHEEIVGVQNGVQVAAEWWQETSPPYANRLIKGPVGHQGEVSDNGTTTFEYDPRSGAITEHSDSSGPPTPIDPVSEVRQELASGQAQVAGTVVMGGATLYKIDLPHGLVGYFDMTNYRPLYLDDPQRDGSVVRVRVVAYGYLPMTAANRALLSVTAQHPGAPVDASPAAATGK